MENTHCLRPMIPIALCLATGIVVGRYAAGAFVPMLMAAAGAAGFILKYWHDHRDAMAVPALFCVMTGYVLIQPWMMPGPSGDHVRQLAGTSNKYTITGKVCRQPVVQGSRVKLTLTDLRIPDGNGTRRVAGNVRLTVMGLDTVPGPGDQVRFFGKLKALHNFQNPGGFDYVGYMAFQGVWASAYATARDVVVEVRSGGFPEKQIHRARQALSALIDSSIVFSDRIVTTEIRAVLKALVVGDRSNMSPRLKEAITRTGTGHMLAISGLHIGIVAAIFFFIFSRSLSHCPPLLDRALSRRSAALLTLIPVLIYGGLTGMSASTQRAIIMVAVVMLSYLTGRRHDLMNTLAVAAVVIIAVHPPAVFSVSFQLSFAAVFWIFVGLFRFPIAKSDTGGWMAEAGHRAMTMLLISACAIFGTLPLVAYYFNRISLIGLPVNLTIVPVIGFIALPLGIGAAFAYPLSTWLAAVCLKLAGLVLYPVISGLHVLSGLPFAAMHMVTPSLLEIGLYYLLAASALMIKPFRWCKYVLVAVLMIAAADVLYWSYQRFWQPNLRVTALDVGQGSAALLEIPGGKTIMVDGGGFSDNRIFDVGRQIIAPFLWRKKINTVDTLILTHPNADHLNGLLYLARQFNVKQVWSNGETADTHGYKEFMDIIRAENIEILAFPRLAGDHRVNEVTMSVLYPPTDFLSRRDKNRWRDTNNNSLVVKATLKNRSFLFTGDIGAPAEAELLDMYPENGLVADVMFVPHHGSRSSSTPDFIRRVEPAVAVVSAGWKNHFGFPHPVVVDRYEAAGAGLYNTGTRGAVIIATDGDKLWVDRPHAPAADVNNGR
ncbi:MAG: DNA internalization-related competence protein ComEC/Rec2 [Desulfobacteraceae bacterium]|nr:DNA internalization-related competence protein ComEC/Rec2 [Desulfobacteraceae bacterium]